MASKRKPKPIHGPKRIIGTFKVHGFRVLAIGEAITLQFKSNEDMRRIGNLLANSAPKCMNFTTAPGHYTDEQMLAVRARANGQ